MMPLLAQVRAVYDGNPSIFAPAGPMAHRLAMLGWGMIITAAIIFVAVVWILLAALWRHRHAVPTIGPAPLVSAERWVLGGGLFMPMLVLAGVFLATLTTLHAQDDHQQPAVDVEVVGHQWWWEVRYPGQDVITADELHIPVGQPVRLHLRSADVIHSFWVPELNGKTDLIPGTENVMYIAASRPGSYRGQCAEYCGLQHAHMALSVVAEPEGAFRAWLAVERQSAHEPLDSIQAAGLQAFLGHSCNFCHTIRGTPASGQAAPDLTHLGSRLTLAGGTLKNTPAALGGWIEDPNRLKPGTKMPPVPMSGGDVNAIVQYLESLK